MKTETKMRLAAAALYVTGALAIGYFSIRLGEATAAAVDALKAHVASKG